MSSNSAANRPLHFSVDFEPDDGGVYEARCNCGRSLGLFPCAEEACDTLMQHAREQGYLEAQEDAISMTQGASGG